MARLEPAGVVTTVDDLVRRARRLARTGSRAVLGITGPPGAGKSTLAGALRRGLVDLAAVVPLDGFHLSNEVLSDLGLRHRKGAPGTFDVGGYVALLERLRSRRDDVVYAPSFDRTAETAVAGAIPVAAETPLVITEGNYLLLDTGGWERVHPLLDEVWFLHVPPAERARRLVGRRTGHGESVSDAAAWVQEVDRVNAEVVAASALRADLVVTLRSDATEPTDAGRAS